MYAAILAKKATFLPLLAIDGRCLFNVDYIYCSSQVFFDILLKYIDDLLSQTPPELHAVDALVW